MAAALAAVVLSGDGLGGGSRVPMTEVVVTLKSPPLARFGRALFSAEHASYLKEIEAQQAVVTSRIETALPDSSIRWHYELVANGLAVVLPKSEAAGLSSIPGVAEVWPTVTYHELVDSTNVDEIGAEQLWGSGLATAGTGMKIGIIDDGLDAAHPYFSPSGFSYPPGFPKGMTKYTTPKVIVQRVFDAPGQTSAAARLPFDPEQSYHATHVSGIAAGDAGANANGTVVSGVAPKAYLGNYRVMTEPTPDFGLDGNSPEITAAIEAAVADGMNVINLSLGEPEVNPARDLVVKAIDAAAAAGVVPVISAGNDFDDFAYGTINSPGSAPDAITVAAVDSNRVIADFSSAGPTPVTLQMKPDVSAPGVDVLSSFPPKEHNWGPLSGTSMAAPEVSGAAALLKEQHPDWTVEEIKSALEQTASPVLDDDGNEVDALREGGGEVDLPAANDPLLFASPTGVSFGELATGASASRTITLADAGGGAGAWTVSILNQAGTGNVAAPATATVPGTLTVTATAGATAGDDTGFVVLTNGTSTRRIPYWFETSAAKLASEPKITLTKPGIYHGTTVGGESLISSYRYPTDTGPKDNGPERVYRVHLKSTDANAGIVVLSGSATPWLTYDGQEDHLAGYTAMPWDLNPYRATYGQSRKISGVDLPSTGWYDFVLDSTGSGGPFTFRYWVNDRTPPKLRIRSLQGAIVVSATDAGAGVDPASVSARVDGKRAVALYSESAGTIRIPAAKGRHALVLSVADYQETKNMEDVGPVLPNTATLRTSVVVR